MKSTSTTSAQRERTQIEGPGRWRRIAYAVMFALVLCGLLVMFMLVNASPSPV